MPRDAGERDSNKRVLIEDEAGWPVWPWILGAVIAIGALAYFLF